ncbi:MAG TPA: hypothetical protein VMB79_00045 [Jatrophihabitans sp.]|nr:hypothetical protein [Jatrophihabitans sp.]
MRTSARTRRRGLVAVGTGLVVLLGGGVAFAYWTTTGSGSGTARVATATAGLTLHATTTGLLAPGTSIGVSFTADNPGPAGLRVGTVHLVSVAADAGHAGCSVADFAMADVPVNQTVPPHGVGVPLTATGSLSYADTTADQSGCMGATLTLTVSSN